MKDEAPDPPAITHDFEELLRYAAENKVILTPKQSLIPLRHIKAILERFEVKESHAHQIGTQIFKKREEMEYPRFYFLDLLAVNGKFLLINRKNVLAKGPNWKNFIVSGKEERLFLLFSSFRRDFNFRNWLLRGGNFAAQIEANAERIWSRLQEWGTGEEIEWKSWALDTIRTCGLRWNSIDQTHAEGLAIWGLEYCFVSAFKYFGMINVEEEKREFNLSLRSIKLNQLGCEYFRRCFRTTFKTLPGFDTFSLN